MEAESPKKLGDSAWGERPFLGSWRHQFAVSLHSKGGQGALWGLLHKGTNPIH